MEEIHEEARKMYDWLSRIFCCIDVHPEIFPH